MISQFEIHKTDFFKRLQQAIVTNVAKYLKPGKPLIYITCSAFKVENEDAVNYIIKELGLHLEEMKVLTGYENKADTMFVARLLAPGDKSALE
jgi:16S rRNA (cytosine967-C5)-methyltransferase